MARHKEYEIGPIKGTHPTSIRAAREAAEAKVAKEIDGDYRPYCLQAFGATLIVWRVPCFGWTYQIRHPSRDDQPADMSGVVASDRNRQDTIAGAIEHMADLYWDRSDDSVPEGFDIAAIAEVRYMDSLRSKDIA